MGIIKALSITNFENLAVNNEYNKTKLKLNFNVSFNHEEGTADPTRIYNYNYGYKVEIMGYTNPDAIGRTPISIFNFERTEYRWVRNSNGFGGRLVRTITEIFNLTGDANLNGQLGVSEVSYTNQAVLSQKIALDLLDINPAIPVELPHFFGGGTYYASEEDQIFARISIVDKRTRTVVSFKDSRVLRGFFGTVES